VDDAHQRPFERTLEEATIVELQAEMTAGHLTARALVDRYLQRIDALDRSGPTLRAVIEVNPDAQAIADALDRERDTVGPRGPLHGIPILIKDNMDTADKMMTTAGSLALMGARPLRDAFVVQRLREAGAVILGCVRTRNANELLRASVCGVARLISPTRPAKRRTPRPSGPGTGGAAQRGGSSRSYADGRGSDRAVHRERSRSALLRRTSRSRAWGSNAV